ncbi:MAG: hypothetical protein NTZ46_04125 [Verrucomicrobia bacterium]|nr:hypothetical protein [Verrucomicrobiota bacterium]
MNQDCKEENLKIQLLQRECDWVVLDEARQCVLCEQTFTGHQVRLLWDNAEAPHLQCPTPRCLGTPSQWIHPGNPLVSEEAWQDWMRLLDTLCEEPVRPPFGVRKGGGVRKIKRLDMGVQRAGSKVAVLRAG